jgi:hypothetical protein
MWNGRQFELTVRSVQHEREYWIAAIKVVGKDDLRGRTPRRLQASLRAKCRQKADDWMIRWTN